MPLSSQLLLVCMYKIHVRVFFVSLWKDLCSLIIVHNDLSILSIDVHVRLDIWTFLVPTPVCWVKSVARKCSSSWLMDCQSQPEGQHAYVGPCKTTCKCLHIALIYICNSHKENINNKFYLLHWQTQGFSSRKSPEDINFFHILIGNTILGRDKVFSQILQFPFVM